MRGGGSPRLLRVAALGLLAGFLLPGAARAGGRIDFGGGRSLMLSQRLQLWTVYTCGARDADGRSLEDRADLYLRRGRIGLSGYLHPRVFSRIWLDFSNLGKEPETGTPGTAQSESNDRFQVWDAFLRWRARPGGPDLTFGYFRPPVGRESLTTAFLVPSFTKALTNTYVREHLVGRTSGRETGADIGGTLSLGVAGLRYDFGLFDTDHEKIAGAGRARYWSPLLAGRLELTLGGGEEEPGGLRNGLVVFTERPALSVAVDLAEQGRTNETLDASGGYAGGFLRNRTEGADLLLRWGGLRLAAEYDRLTRWFSEDFIAAAAGLPAGEYTDRVWHLRLAWAFRGPGGCLLQPVMMGSTFKGDAVSAVYPGGRHRLFDLGLNLYLDEQRIKVSLHSTRQTGAPVSHYSGGLDEAGSFIGLGAQFVY